jgi:serine/threonine protein kinase
MSASVSQFLELLEKSQLLTPDELARARSGTATAADVLADRLVRAKLITAWHASELLKGKYRFFLGKYRMLERIGHGGMGIVFKVQERAGLKRIFALKLMNKSLAEKPGSLNRFLREVKAASMVDHPNIVRALDADHVGDIYFLILEYVEGRDLAVWLKELGRLPVDWACECTRQAALGLHHAHEKGLIHRDVKPSNVLVVADDTKSIPSVKLLDLGVARFIDPEDQTEHQTVTVTGEILGSFDYVAPEQAVDAKAADRRSDVYSLGSMLFHLVTGELAFPGTSPTAKLMARAIEEAPRASSVFAGVPPKLDAILAKMLARDPAVRHQTALEVAEDLERLSTSALDERDRSQVDMTMAWQAPPPEADDDEGTTAALKNVFAHLADATQDSGAQAPSLWEIADAESSRSSPVGMVAQRAKEGRLAMIIAGVVGAVLLVGLGIFAMGRIKTPTGKVLITVSQPSADISIDNGRLRAASPSVRQATPFDLPLGEHDLEVVKDGFKPYTTRFQVHAATETRLNVRLEPEGK